LEEDNKKRKVGLKRRKNKKNLYHFLLSKGRDCSRKVCTLLDVSKWSISSQGKRQWTLSVPLLGKLKKKKKKKEKGCLINPSL